MHFLSFYKIDTVHGVKRPTFPNRLTLLDILSILKVSSIIGLAANRQLMTRHCGAT
jgi:hypothetical protein